MYGSGLLGIIQDKARQDKTGCYVSQTTQEGCSLVSKNAVRKCLRHTGLQTEIVYLRLWYGSAEFRGYGCVIGSHLFVWLQLFINDLIFPLVLRKGPRFNFPFYGWLWCNDRFESKQNTNVYDKLKHSAKVRNFHDIHPNCCSKLLYMPIESMHDDVITWKHFPRYWPFVRGIHRSPVISSHKDQWCGALMFSMICAWFNVWVNNRGAGDLRHNRTHYDVIVMNQHEEALWDLVVWSDKCGCANWSKWCRAIQWVLCQLMSLLILLSDS